MYRIFIMHTITYLRDSILTTKFLAYVIYVGFLWHMWHDLLSCAQINSDATVALKQQSSGKKM